MRDWCAEGRERERIEAETLEAREEATEGTIEETQEEMTGVATEAAVPVEEFGECVTHYLS